MDQLCAVAEVSKRTVYQHFGSKDELVAEYLRELNVDPIATAEADDVTPRERLLAAYEQLLAPRGAPLCPFIGAAVEIADPDHPARAQARDYKRTVAAGLTRLAREAGAADPESLGEQLALLVDGASVRARALGVDTTPTALSMAATLIDWGLPAARPDALPARTSG